MARIEFTTSAWDDALSSSVCHVASISPSDKSSSEGTMMALTLSLNLTRVSAEVLVGLAVLHLSSLRRGFIAIKDRVAGGWFVMIVLATRKTLLWVRVCIFCFVNSVSYQKVLLSSHSTGSPTRKAAACAFSPYSTLARLLRSRGSHVAVLIVKMRRMSVKQLQKARLFIRSGTVRFPAQRRPNKCQCGWASFSIS